MQLTFSSGINRIPSYVARISQGALDAKATPDMKKLTPVVAQVFASTLLYFLFLTK